MMLLGVDASPLGSTATSIGLGLGSNIFILVQREPAILDGSRQSVWMLLFHVYHGHFCVDDELRRLAFGEPPHFALLCRFLAHLPAVVTVLCTVAAWRLSEFAHTRTVGSLVLVVQQRPTNLVARDLQTNRRS